MANEDSRSDGTVTPRLDRRADLFKVTARLAAPEPEPESDEGPLGDQPKPRS